MALTKLVEKRLDLLAANTKELRRNLRIISKYVRLFVIRNKANLLRSKSGDDEKGRAAINALEPFIERAETLLHNKWVLGDDNPTHAIYAMLDRIKLIEKELNKGKLKKALQSCNFMFLCAEHIRGYFLDMDKIAEANKDAHPFVANVHKLYVKNKSTMIKMAKGLSGQVRILMAEIKKHPEIASAKVTSTKGAGEVDFEIPAGATA